MAAPPDNAVLYKSRAAYNDMMQAYDAALEKVTVPYETTFVNTRHGVTHVLMAGKADAPPLVLWHGMNANLTMWVPEINLFAQTHHVYAIDTIGSTGKSAPTRLNKKTTGYAEWASDTLASLGLDCADMAGISGGGWMILRLASLAPERIQRAILMSSGGFGSLRPGLLLRIIPRLLFHQLIGTPEKAMLHFARMMTPPGVPVPPEEIEMFRRFGQYKSEQDVPPLPDEVLRRLTAPTYVLMGEYEAAFNPDAVLERARRVLPNLRHAELVPGVGHGMTGHNPALVHGKVLQFLNEPL